MSDSVHPHRRQPTRLCHPWDSPGKNTEVGCHFLLQCVKVKRESEVIQSCLTLHDPMDCSLPGSSVCGLYKKDLHDPDNHDDVITHLEPGILECEATQSCPTLSDPKDCSLPGSSVHGIFQARVLEWGAIAFSV